MGYIETILGYGYNHMDFPLSLLFKKITKGDNSEIKVDETAVYEAIQAGESLEAVLHDDIYMEGVPEERIVEIDDEDEIHQLLDCTTYISRDFGCSFRRSCCFVGIVISDGETYHKGKKNETDRTDSIEDKILAAQKWIKVLESQGRFNGDTKLVMVRNCCS